ncbi:MAG: PHP domain-containing protein, partial [Alistipes sp.]|nr:PHP domain-containing protein [Alistipes sp.]
MQDFVHLHVHTQYSLLDGQASIPKLVDKAIADGMRGIAITDHGNMFGVKEFWNYIKKKNGARRDKIKALNAEIETLQAELEQSDDSEKATALAQKKAELDSVPKEDFKCIIGCEVYVARRGMHLKDGKEDQSGYHLVLLAKNKKGYHNLIKIVSKAWTEGYYMRPRTERAELEK